MTRYPRAFQYRRVPAAPPRMIPIRQVFEFNLQDCMYRSEPPQAWEDFCRRVGNTVVKPFRMESFTAFHREVAKGGLIRGKHVRVDHSPFDDITITVTQPTPRISAKLAATFPWKLRKHLKQP